MLHFLLDNLSNVYIGVCDWGEAGRVGEHNPSPYGYAIEEETAIQQQVWWWVVLKLFYTYENEGSIESLQRMGLACLQIPKSKTYSMGKLAKFIWQEDIDTEYFMDSSTITRRNLKIND